MKPEWIDIALVTGSVLDSANKEIGLQKPPAFVKLKGQVYSFASVRSIDSDIYTCRYSIVPDSLLSLVGSMFVPTNYSKLQELAVQVESDSYRSGLYTLGTKRSQANDDVVSLTSNDLENVLDPNHPAGKRKRLTE